MRAQALLVWIALALTTSAQDFSRPGPLVVAAGTTTVTRTDASTFSALLFYPATSPAGGATPAPSTTPWPAMCFGHGFLCPPALYAQTMRHLASWGFVVIAPQSALELFPSHGAYAADLRQSLYWLRDESRNPGSVWFGRVSTNRWGLSGHSMGGGTDLLAAADEPEIDAVANLAAAETWPSAIDAAAGIQVPLCFIAGSEDRIAPPRRHARPMFDAAGAPRLFALLNGGSHCGFVDIPLPDVVCDESALPRPVQLAKSRALLSAFFRLYLHDDEKAVPFVWGPALALDPAFRIDADPGFDLDPAYQRKQVPAGTAADFQLRVTNRQNHAAQLVFTASGNTNGLVISPTVTDPVAPGGMTSVYVRVLLPAGSARAFTMLDMHSTTEARTRTFAVLGVEKTRAIRK